jgi:hypothetical protein
MRRLSPKYLLLATGLVAAASLASAGCEDNDSALFVRSVLAVRSPQCEVLAEPNQMMLLNGVYDVAVDPNDYTAVLLVGNQLTRRASRTQVRTETSRVILHGAIVRVLAPDGSELKSFTVDGTGAVDPASGEEPGYGLLATTLLDKATGQGQVDQQVNVGVRAFGETLGGTEIESAELFFPIFVCNGCLVSFPADAIDPTTDPPTCTANVDALSAENVPCQIGQDFPVDCRACSGNTACQL